MKNGLKKVRAEFDGSSWAFVDGEGNRVAFDQALIDATYTSRSAVEGYVVSVHGIAHEVADNMPARLRRALGISAVHSVGHGPTIKRLRLMPSGAIERFEGSVQ